MIGFYEEDEDLDIKPNRRLPREFASRWIEALRSGEYGQTDGGLYFTSTDKYCCLGVAGAICGVPNELLASDGFVRSDNICDASLLLYKTAVEKGYPLELIYGDAAGTYLAEELASLNDDGKTFNEIADWIEKEVELYG